MVKKHKKNSETQSKRRKDKNKVLVVGIDGASFGVIGSWTKEGLLPNLGNLLMEGVHGDLQSTIPPITGPAWASFQTGKNPGRHGIYDFLSREESSYKLKPINSCSIKHKTLWKIISEQGKKVGVINVPLTYPPEEIDGFIISGLLTPSTDSQYTYPKGLKRELQSRVKNYTILPDQRFEERKIRKWIDSIKCTIFSRKEATLYLMKRYEWDFLMTHFYGTDLVQHRMWHTIKRESKNPVLEIYQAVDTAIGEILSAVPEGTCIFIISDHGFGPLYHHVYLNNWLLKEGYLKLRSNFATRWKRVLHEAGFTPANVYRLMSKIGVLSKGLKLGKGQRYNLVGKFFLSAKNIDWSRTKAYSYGNIGQIYVNRTDREPGGIVSDEELDSLIDELVGKLTAFNNSEIGAKVFDKIFKRDQVYTGERLEDAPEIVLLPKKMEAIAIGVNEFISNKVVEPSFAFTGGHRMNGIFIGVGTDLKTGCKIKNANIIDLAPTILYTMGLNIPEDIDGKVLDAMYREEFLKNNKKTYFNGKTGKRCVKESFSNGEEKEIRKRLENLGYVS